MKLLAIILRFCGGLAVSAEEPLDAIHSALGTFEQAQHAHIRSYSGRALGSPSCSSLESALDTLSDKQVAKANSV